LTCTPSTARDSATRHCGDANAPERERTGVEGHKLGLAKYDDGAAEDRLVRMARLRRKRAERHKKLRTAWATL
jgi:hypothetical protein